MRASDLERMRTRRPNQWRPDMFCADCLGPPHCPQLEDSLWNALWSLAKPLAPRRCNCDKWRPPAYAKIRGIQVLRGFGMHWERCDLIAPRRPLLCLHCAERRLGRRLSLEDLSPCMSNYHVAVESVRHGLAALAVAREEFRSGSGRLPTEPAEYDAVDARARALVSGRTGDARIVSAPATVESLLVAAARAAMRELGLTGPDWSRASALCKIIWARVPGLRHLCATRRGDDGEIGLQADVGLDRYEMPWPTPSPCDDLDEFFDGELTGTARADAFRGHLGSCERCTRVLEGRMHELAVVHVRVSDDEAQRLVGSLQRGLPAFRAMIADAAIADAGVIPWMEYTVADLDRAIGELERRRAALTQTTLRVGATPDDDSVEDPEKPDEAEHEHVGVSEICVCPDGER